MQTIGERLEEARKKKGISIREAAEATKIRGDYLQKFESNQFDIGLTEIYTRGFLRNYSNYLKLPADRILNDYTALGRGDIRPRQPSREVYGRMDITVATAGEASDRAAPPDANAAPEPAPGQARAQPRYPRGSGPALPAGPDPAVVFKYVKWGGGAVIVLLALLIIKALFTGDKTPPASTPRTTGTPVISSPPPATPAGAFTYTLVATGPVSVRVNVRLETADSHIDGDEIFKGLMLQGQRQTITLSGPQTLYASAGENLTLIWAGNPIKIGEDPKGFRGSGNVRLDIPPTARQNR